MTFANPWMFAFFFPLAVVAWRLFRKVRRSGIRYPAIARLPSRTAGWRAKMAALTPYMMISGLTLMIVASARPRLPLARERKSVDAIAMAIAVDVSNSMNALDLTPKGVRPSSETTRLAVVKKMFAEFVDRRPDDLIGLVTFGTYASTRSPLTADHEALLNVLKGVEIPSVAIDAQGFQIGEEEGWTAIGDGLAMALARLKDAKPKSKIVILLSDGESNRGAVKPDEAAKAAASMGVKVYAIGVGTNSVRTPVLWRNMFGQRIEYCNMAFNEEQLKSIASTTGGTYFSVNDRDSLEEALMEIDQLETTRLEADTYDRWAEHFAAFLLAGALLVLAAVSLSMSAARRMA